MLKKVILGIIIVILTMLIVLSLSLPTILKRYIEANDEKLIGRQVTIGKIGINPLIGRISITDFKLFEKDGETLFFGFDKFSTRINLWGLMRSKYEIRKIEITHPIVNIVLFDEQFNFDDLLTLFNDTTPSSATEQENSPKVKWELKDFSLKQGAVNYSDQMFGTTLKAEDLEINSPGLAWNTDTLNSDISFRLESGGEAMIRVLLNLKTNELFTRFDLLGLNLQPFTAPLKEYISISEMKGELTNKMDLWMNLDDPTDIALSGKFDIDHFGFKDQNNEDIFTLKNLSIGIDSINVKNDLYRLKSININQPYVLVEMYERGNNWTLLMPDNGNDTLQQDTTLAEEPFDSYNVFALMAYYIRDLAKTYVATNYKFDSINVNGGRLQYNDYTLQEIFSYSITEMNIRSKQIDSHADTIRFDMSVVLNGESKGVAKIMIDPQDFNNMTVNYDFYETNLAALTPYSVYYVSYPINRAILNYSSRTTIHEGNLKSLNKINITGFRFGQKTRSMTAFDIPVKLAIAILRDVHGNINLEIPVKGSLKDPKFKLGKVILNILKNLVVKVATAPFRLLADAFSANEDDLKEIQFNFLETKIGKYQLKSLEPLSKVIQQKDELNFQLIQLVDTIKEMDSYAALEARKAFYAIKIMKSEPSGIDFNEELLNKVNSIPMNDSLFIAWMDQTMQFDNQYLPVQKKCRLLIGERKAKEAVHQLMAQREENILNYFNTEKGIASERIVFGKSTDLKHEDFSKSNVIIDRPKFIVQITVN